MGAKKTPAGRGSSNSFIKRHMRNARRKPTLLIIPGLILCIIIIAVILVLTLAGGKGPEAGPEPETLVKEEAHTYDPSMWRQEDGFMFYDDEGVSTETGIDVSEWSNEIDWEAVKAQGIEFVICRVGYRGYETGKFDFDSKLADYLDGASAAGLKTGVYFVTQAVDEEEAIEEAEEVLKKIEGHKVNMPIYIDCEENTGTITRTDNMTREQHTSNVIAFCETVEAAGYRGGIYSNELWIRNHLNMDELSDYDIWVARYADTPPSDIAFNMWQYTSTGSLDGISTDVDLNIRLK